MSSGDANGSLEGLVDHLFRRKAGEMVASLTRVFGPERLDLAEEVVQEAMLAALATWPFRGIPDNPGGWLLTVARNRALDRLRRETLLRSKAHLIEIAPRGEADGTFLGGEIEDDQLRMIFMCAHPGIAPESRVALILKVVGGFSVDEIARALLSRSDAVAQRIVRAKKTIREERLRLEIPADPRMLEERLDTALEVLYLMFNEGYTAAGGEALIREEICGEAIRLARLLAARTGTAVPKTRALLALMLFQAARFPARHGAGGSMILLGDQDRTLWDRASIAEGFQRFAESIGGDELSHFHVEAAIAAVHVEADCFERTDWRRLVDLYDQLLRIRPSPVAVLNRSVAIGRLEGPARGLEALQEIAADPRLGGYALVPSVMGDYWLQLGEHDRAAAALEQALRMPMSVPERTLLEQKLARCRQT